MVQIGGFYHGKQEIAAGGDNMAPYKDRNIIKKKDGFTLVEIVVSIVLIGLVFSLAGMFLDFSFRAERKVEAEYDLQTEVRKATEALNNAIRNSSVTFIVPGSVFASTKKDKWSYFGLEDQNKIVQYTWNPDSGTHDRSVVVSARDGILYNLYFKQNNPGSKLVEYYLDVINENDDTKSVSVSSELAALNSLAVDDGGSDSNPAVAVAFRSDNAPRPEEVTTQREVTIAISLVLDVSGSMAYDMNGRKKGDRGFNSNEIRMDIMKREAQKLIDSYVALGGIEVSIIPYSNTANNPGDLLAATSRNQNTLRNKISGLKADGGTNTGDGLRRGYYQLRNNYNKNYDKEIVNYIIMLTDGEPTYFSGDNRYNANNYSSYIPKLGDGNCDSNYIWGVGNNDGRDGATNLARSMSYCNNIGQKIKQDTELNVGTFVIGFSAVPAEITNNKTVAKDYCGGRYYEAGSEIALETAFQEITSTILRETWHIYGPY